MDWLGGKGAASLVAKLEVATEGSMVGELLAELVAAEDESAGVTS